MDAIMFILQLEIYITRKVDKFIINPVSIFTTIYVYDTLSPYVCGLFSIS